MRNSTHSTQRDGLMPLLAARKLRKTDLLQKKNYIAFSTCNIRVLCICIHDKSISLKKYRPHDMPPVCESLKLDFIYLFILNAFHACYFKHIPVCVSVEIK